MEKIFILYQEKNNRLIKNIIYSILKGLILLKKNKRKNNKIDMIEINYNNNEYIKKEKDRYDNYSEDINVKNSYNTNKNSMQDDSRVSYGNISDIITTTQIKSLSNSSDFKNTINNISININNSKLIIPPQRKYSDESENLSSSRRNNYQITDISKINSNEGVLNSEQFKNLIDFIQYKNDLFIKKLNNINSPNVYLNLYNGLIKNEYGNIYTIKEEENESYDSLSLQRSILNSGKVTPSKKDMTKRSVKNSINLDELNYNFNNVFNSNKEYLNKNKVIEELNISGGEEDEKIIDNNIITDIDTNKENKIMSDLDMKKNYKKKEEENNVDKNKEKDCNKKENNNEENKINIFEKENKEDNNDIVNYNTPVSREKAIDKLCESIKRTNINKKLIINEFNTNDNNNDNFKISDFNNIINNEEEKIENIDNENNKRIIIKTDENIENDKTFKKRNNNNENEDNLTIKKDIDLLDEKIIISSSNIKFPIRESLLSQHIKTTESSIIETNKENEDNKKIKILEIESNTASSLNYKSQNTNNDNIKNEFLRYTIIDNKNLKLLFCNNNDDNYINNNIYSIPLESYIYILQLCLNKNVSLSTKYGKYIQKLIKKVEKNKYINIDNNNDLNNKYYENRINEEINNFEHALNYLKRCYLYLICKKRKLKNKKEKDKLMADFNISKKQTDLKKIFDNVLLLINNKKLIDQNKYNLYIKIVMNILKKYEKIKKSEISEAKIKDMQNKLDIPENDALISDNNLNLFNELKKEIIKDFYLYHPY